MKQNIFSAVVFATLTVAAAVGPREARAMCRGNPSNHCHEATQFCDGPCTALPCKQRVDNFDNPPNAFSTSFFAGAIGHCANRGDRNAILECAWREVVQSDHFPEVASDTCMRNGLF